jgi:hypothetical protein
VSCAEAGSMTLTNHLLAIRHDSNPPLTWRESIRISHKISDAFTLACKIDKRLFAQANQNIAIRIRRGPDLWLFHPRSQ